MIASDGILANGKGHPRAAGCYARVLGRYVREQHALSLMEAMRKMSLLLAQRLGLKDKGCIRIGADADLTIFDPVRVTDRAMYENPAQYSEGIPYVLVNGFRSWKTVRYRPTCPRPRCNALISCRGQQSKPSRDR